MGCGALFEARASRGEGRAALPPAGCPRANWRAVRRSISSAAPDAARLCAAAASTSAAVPSLSTPASASSSHAEAKSASGASSAAPADATATASRSRPCPRLRSSAGGPPANSDALGQVRSTRADRGANGCAESRREMSNRTRSHLLQPCTSCRHAARMLDHPHNDLGAAFFLCRSPFSNASNAEPLKTLIPALDHAAGAQLEDERLAAATRRVELLARRARRRRAVLVDGWCPVAREIVSSGER